MDPLELLQKMQRDSMARMPTLPQEEKAVDLWSGVGFRIGEMNLLAPLDLVSEILPVPVITPVPGTKSWLKGIANVRGNLITIVDLPEFLEGKPLLVNDRTRLMVINVGEINTAVMVEDIYGMRHFEESNRQHVGASDDMIGAFLGDAFLQNDVLWGVFDLRALATNTAFHDVALH